MLDPVKEGLLNLNSLLSELLKKPNISDSSAGSNADTAPSLTITSIQTVEVIKTNGGSHCAEFERFHLVSNENPALKFLPKQEKISQLFSFITCENHD